MGTYTIYLFTNGLEVPSFRVFECADDAEAASAAEARAEVRRGEIFICMVERPAAQRDAMAGISDSQAAL